MSFASPYALIALVTAATPIVIYLILRRRKTEVAWGASYLLRLTLAGKKKSSLWRQLIVLATRAAIIASMILLLAAPHWINSDPRGSVPALPPSPVHRVVLLDHSISMTANDEGGVRLVRLRQAVNGLLAQLRAGDVVTLVSLLTPTEGEEPATREVSGPVEPERVPALWNSFVPREGDLDLGSALAAGLAAIARTPRATPEIYVFSDFPREMKDEIADLAWAAGAATARATRMTLVRLAGEDEAASNVVIRSVEIGSDLIPVGVPVTLHVDVANYSDGEAAATIDVEIDGTVSRSRSSVFKANEERRVPITITLSEPGDILMRVRTDRSRLPRLGERALCAEVVEKLSVWVVAEDAAADDNSAAGETEFLIRALSAEANRTGAFTVERVSPSVLRSEIPGEIDVIVLAGLRFALAASADPLMRFVNRGGGLVISMTADVEQGGYNEHYAGLLPALLLGPARASVEPDEFALVKADSSAAAGPLFEEFVLDERFDLDEVRVYNHMRVNRDAPLEGVVFALDDGAPLLIRSALGRGTVLLLTSSLGISWNTMPVRRCYVPFLVRLLHDAANGSTFATNVAPDERLVMKWVDDGAAELVSPDGAVRTIAPVEWAGGRYVVIDDHASPGLHRVQSDHGERVRFFTVKGPLVESDLRTLEPDATARIERALGARVHKGWREAVAALGPEDAVVRAWPAIVVLMLALYAFEAWFVRKL